MNDGRILILEWRRCEPPRGSLQGYMRAQFQSGLVICDIAVHQNSGKSWCSPPAKPWTRDDAVVRDENGRAKWLTVIDFANHSVRRRWSEALIAALRQQHPDALPEPPADDAQDVARRVWR